jgi:hypothetical protein
MEANRRGDTVSTRRWLWVVLALAIIALKIHGTAQIALVAIVGALVLANVILDRRVSRGNRMRDETEA